MGRRVVKTSDEADAFTLAKIGQALIQDVELTKFSEGSY